MRSGSMLLTALLITGFATTTATAEPSIAWRDCDKNAAVDCATITVPIDHARPATGTIDVHIARIPATGRKQGTLFYLPGGPGDSGVDRLQNTLPVVPDEVLERFDVVSFDPRGTNRSHPVTCDADLAAGLWDLNVIPDAGGRLADAKAYVRDLGATCRERTGPLIDHVDSVSVARDVDVVRAALGERELTLYGRSYGTLVGQMYAENFPRRVRGLVLDSVFDHSLPVSRLLTQQAATGEDSFDEFAKWCAATTDCALHGQDVGQVYGDLYERSVNGELPLTPMELNRVVVNFFYGPNWVAAAKWLAEPTPVSMPVTSAFPIAMFCADHRIRISSQAEWTSLWRKQSAAAPTLRTHYVWPITALCSAWPAATPNPQHRTEVDRSVPPVLLINAVHDPADSYEWAKSVNRQIDRSVLLTYDGWGHGITMRTSCTKAVFTDYVVDGEVPRPGTHCPAEMGEQ